MDDPLSTHPEYCASDADVSVRSSDNIIFNLHSTNLKTHTLAFPFDHVADSKDPASFDEHSDVLAILFKFIYPEAPLPGLADVSFELLKKVAYASHKYQIAAAMAVCDIRMEISVQQDPAAVLGYAYRYFGGDGRIDRLAIHTISQPVSKILQEMPLDGFSKWVLYREKAALDLWPWHSGASLKFPTAPAGMYTTLESRVRTLAASSVRAFDPR